MYLLHQVKRNTSYLGLAVWDMSFSSIKRKTKKETAKVHVACESVSNLKKTCFTCLNSYHFLQPPLSPFRRLSNYIFQSPTICSIFLRWFRSFILIQTKLQNQKKKKTFCDSYLFFKMFRILKTTHKNRIKRNTFQVFNFLQNNRSVYI